MMGKSAPDFLCWLCTQPTSHVDELVGDDPESVLPDDVGRPHSVRPSPPSQRERVSDCVPYKSADSRQMWTTGPTSNLQRQFGFDDPVCYLASMRDLDVRRVLRGRLNACYGTDPTTIVVEELGLRGGTVRADLAVVNGYFKGFEIKSDSDTLKRLERQSDIYSKVFDTMTLVVGERHLTEAKGIIPKWWGIDVAISGAPDNTVRLEPMRSESLNSDVDALDLVQLLWREEVLEILGRVAPFHKLASKPRRFLWQTLAACITLTEMRDFVREYLKRRTRWRFDEGQLPSDGTSQPCATSSDSRCQRVHSRNRRYIHRPN